MIRILSEKSEMVNPEINLYANKKRLAWLQTQSFDAHISATLQHQAVIANEMLNAGYTQQAIDQYNDILHTIDSLNMKPPETFMTAIYDLLLLPISAMEKKQNCLDGHNPESCIMPIRGAGIHRKKASAEKAINIYKSLLRRQIG